MDDNAHFFFAGLFIGLVVAFFATSAINNMVWRATAVEKGYAQYREDTGEWTWKCDLDKTATQWYNMVKEK